jgi:outer membrane protein assembly factor BamB
MKPFFLILILLIFPCKVFCQEVILNTNFAVRDFKIKGNTLIYIEKRDIKSFNLQTKKPDTLFANNSFFIGGYGLNIYCTKESNEIVTSSNELIRDISSIRFYDIKKKEVDKYEVYYSTGLIDFLLLEENKMMFLSKKNKCIDIFNYDGSPRYKKIDSIKTDSYSRKLQFKDDKLYYITDNGGLYEYNLTTRNNKLLNKTHYLLTNFLISEGNIYATTFNGFLIKVDIKTGSIRNRIIIGNEIVEALEILDNKYIITGDWSGNIKVINKNNFKITKQYYNKNNKRIIKIVSSENNCFFSSSSDKTIKKWKIN